MKDKVSIIIPAYNQAQYLADAIESALKQTVLCRVIVVNDGSTDNTAEIAQNYPVMLINKKNGGLPNARNTGIREANSEWILTLDSDDIIAPDFVEKCLKKAEQTGAAIIGTGQKEFGDSANEHIFNERPEFKDFLMANQINCCSLFKKQVWKTVGGYDERMNLGYEDWDFWLRATRAGYTVATVPELLFFYRKHGNSMVSNTKKHHFEIVNYMHQKIRNKSSQFFG